MVLPGSTASPLDPGSVGLEVDYIDCATCPTALTIDSTGRFVGWMERNVEGTATITVKRIDDGWTLAYEVADTSDLPLFGSLDIGSVEVDGTNLISAKAIVNDRDPASDRGVVFDLTSRSNGPIAIGPVGTRMAFGS